VVRFWPKDFRQRRPDGKGGWEWNLKGVTRVLFNLPAVLQTARKGGRIHIVEGEKDAKAIERAGGTATTNSGGAGKWDDSYSPWLQGADVIVVADDDPPGWEHAWHVADSVRPWAKVVEVRLPQAGNDASDHLAAGFSLIEFALAPAPGSREWDPVVDATEMISEPDVAYSWLIGGPGKTGLLESQGRVLLAAGEGAGKSLLVLQLAVQAAAGIVAFGKWEVQRPLRTVYFDLEMGRRSTRRRLERLIKAAMLSGRPVAPGMLDIVHRPEGIDFLDRAERRWVFDYLKKIEPQLIVIDPLWKAIPTDSLHEKEMKPFLRLLDRLRVEFGVGIIIAHHLRKRGSGDSQRGRDSSDVFGSSALLRWPETVMLLGDELLRVDKDREGFFPHREFGVQWDQDLDSAQWFAMLRDSAPLVGVSDLILEALALEAMSATRLADHIDKGKARVLKALGELERMGKVSRIGTKTATRWILAGSGDEDPSPEPSKLTEPTPLFRDKRDKETD
jgi:hypothetical protein